MTVDQGKATDRNGIDERNRRFWDELCGSALAKDVGIVDRSVESLSKFDAAYFSYYPYLLSCVPIETFSGEKVLEVGLGYGTLGQAIAEHGADYTGLDIAQGPVNMMNHRLHSIGNAGRAQQGSMLECPFADATFDVVVSIGCFHHTGNLQRCIDETWRILRPGGRAFIMVYNKFSYRNWLRWPMATIADACGASRPLTAGQRAAYDSSSDGVAAPETVFTSVNELRCIFSRFSEISVRKRNWGGVGARGITLVPRGFLLNVIGPLCGLDIYVSGIK